jgi:hypothetical protein
MNSRLRAINNISLWTGGAGFVIGAVAILFNGEIGWGLLCLAAGMSCFASMWIGRIRDKSS